jgi:DNA anti-recombination protein RmuC
LIVYAALLHPALERHEQAIDELLLDAKQVVVASSTHLGRRGLSWLEQYAAETPEHRGSLMARLLSGHVRPRSQTFPTTNRSDTKIITQNQSILETVPLQSGQKKNSSRQSPNGKIIKPTNTIKRTVKRGSNNCSRRSSNDDDTTEIQELIGNMQGADTYLP